MENLNCIYKNKKRLMALALSLTMMTSFSSCKENNKSNNQITEDNYQICDEVNNENKFFYYSYPNGYYFARNYSQSGRPSEHWHAIKKSELNNKKYDFVIKTSTISNVISVINDESTTYLVPKGFELRIFDGILFGVPKSENFVYENSSNSIIIEELSDGTKAYTIPTGFKIYENLDNNSVYYDLEENLVKKIK